MFRVARGMFHVGHGMFRVGHGLNRCPAHVLNGRIGDRIMIDRCRLAGVAVVAETGKKEGFFPSFFMADFFFWVCP